MVLTTSLGGKVQLKRIQHRLKASAFRAVLNQVAASFEKGVRRLTKHQKEPTDRVTRGRPGESVQQLTHTVAVGVKQVQHNVGPEKRPVGLEPQRVTEEERVLLEVQDRVIRLLVNAELVDTVGMHRRRRETTD